MARFWLDQRECLQCELLRARQVLTMYLHVILGKVQGEGSESLVESRGAQVELVRRGTCLSWICYGRCYGVKVR
jgi:hypothetical protein